MIMQGNTRRTLTRSGRVAILAIAALALPLLPVHGQGSEPYEMEQALHERHAHLEQLHKQLEELKMHMQELHQRGELEKVHTVQAHLVELHEVLAMEESKAEELQVHLHQIQDRVHEGATQDPHPKRVLDALHKAIAALRDRDQDEEAEVLAQLMRELEQGLDRADRHVMDWLITDREAQIAEEHDQRMDLERHRILAELDTHLADEHDRRMDQEMRRLAEMEAHLADEHDRRMAVERDRAAELEARLADEHARLMAVERDQAAELEARRSDEHALRLAEDRHRVDMDLTATQRDRLQNVLHRGNVQQDDQMRRLEARVDELAEIVKKLAALAEKQAAERRQRIR